MSHQFLVESGLTCGQLRERDADRSADVMSSEVLNDVLQLTTPDKCFEKTLDKCLVKPPNNYVVNHQISASRKHQIIAS